MELTKMTKLDSIENIVRVMDFHALARIDKAKHSTESTRPTESLLESIIRQIYYNKNLNIDKKLLIANQSGIDLSIYIGSDLSFCGDFNSSIITELLHNTSSKKIIVGQKIRQATTQDCLYSLSKEEFYRDSSHVSQIIDDYLSKKQIKSVNVIYNKYYSIDDIRLEKAQIFPIEFEKQTDERYDIDFTIEEGTSHILSNIMAVYLNYKVIIAEKSSWAAENVNRERIARESLKRIEDLKAEEKIQEAQARNQKKLLEQIDNFERLKWRHA